MATYLRTGAVCHHAVVATTCQSRPQTTGRCRGPVRSESAPLPTPSHHSEKVSTEIKTSRGSASEVKQISIFFNCNINPILIFTSSTCSLCCAGAYYQYLIFYSQIWNLHGNNISSVLCSLSARENTENLFIRKLPLFYKKTQYKFCTNAPVVVQTTCSLTHTSRAVSLCPPPDRLFLVGFRLFKVKKYSIWCCFLHRPQHTHFHANLQCTIFPFPI